MKNDHPQRIELLHQMIEEKVDERKVLINQLEQIQIALKQTDVAINTFQIELEKLTGEKVNVSQTLLRGTEIGNAAIEALGRLGGTAHYSKIKEEIENYYTISGINDKSKADSVWNHLNKSEAVIKLGRGEFSLQPQITSDDKKAICRKYGLDPDNQSPWDMKVVWQAHHELATNDLSDFLNEMTEVGGKDWARYYREVVKQGKNTPRL